MEQIRNWRNDITDSSVVFASYLELLAIVRGHGGRAFVWPDEGSFSGERWQFNQQHNGFEPIWIDPTTAKMLCMVHDALTKPENRQKFTSWVAKSRGTFGTLVEFAWERVK